MLVRLKSLSKLNSRKSGVSLMYVVVVGGISASAALVLGSSLFPIYNHVSALTQRDQVIDISENRNLSITLRHFFC